MFNEAMLEAGDLRYAQVPDNLAEQPKVAILMATYNGAKYLNEQLDSIIQQTYRDWTITVSDDGSSDNTLDILRRYQTQLGETRLSIRRGPCRGFAANYLSLVCEPSIGADFFTFCDQDDRWHPDRLERALQWLREIPEERPALYCGRTRLVDSQGRYLGESPLFLKTPSFANALVQSLAGGNTMVFNEAARALLAEAGELPVVSHDWWAYMLISGSGGLVKYDEIPLIDYRQHGANLIGANSSLADRLYRLRRMFAGHFKEWNNTNLDSLSRCLHLLLEQHHQTFQAFATAREAAFLQRCLGVLKSGVHRQTIFGDLGLLAATVLGKI